VILLGEGRTLTLAGKPLRIALSGFWGIERGQSLHRSPGLLQKPIQALCGIRHGMHPFRSSRCHPFSRKKVPQDTKGPRERVRSLGVLLFGLFGVSWIPVGSLGFFPLLDGPFVSLVSEGETEDLVEHPRVVRVVLPVERSVLQNEFGDPVQSLLCSHRTVDQLR